MYLLRKYIFFSWILIIWAKSKTPQPLKGHVLIGGGNGFIGTRLEALLRMHKYNVSKVCRERGYLTCTWNDLYKDGLPDNITAVINLAGENIFKPFQFWTKGFKRKLINSRVNTTKILTRAVLKAEKKPKVFITMSGVGIYKPSRTESYTEKTKTKKFDFLSGLAIKTEAAAVPTNIPIRQACIRSGTVLGREGGMVKRLYPLYKLGLGGPLGSGSQFFPWIHVLDLARLIQFVIETEKAVGVIHGVAPQIINHTQFSKAFAKKLGKPLFMRYPEFLLNLWYNKERAALLTTGQRVLTKKAQRLGFKFIFSDIEAACEQIVNHYKLIDTEMRRHLKL